jgi:hypothetical protein
LKYCLRAIFFLFKNVAKIAQINDYNLSLDLELETQAAKNEANAKLKKREIFFCCCLPLESS